MLKSIIIEDDEESIKVLIMKVREWEKKLFKISFFLSIRRFNIFYRKIYRVFLYSRGFKRI